jgi:hypothetical protein
MGSGKNRINDKATNTKIKSINQIDISMTKKLPLSYKIKNNSFETQSGSGSKKNYAA